MFVFSECSLFLVNCIILILLDILEEVTLHLTSNLIFWQLNRTREWFYSLHNWAKINKLTECTLTNGAKEHSFWISLLLVSYTCMCLNPCFSHVHWMSLNTHQEWIAPLPGHITIQVRWTLYISVEHWIFRYEWQTP